MLYFNVLRSERNERKRKGNPEGRIFPAGSGSMGLSLIDSPFRPPPSHPHLPPPPVAAISPLAMISLSPSMSFGFPNLPPWVWTAAIYFNPHSMLFLQNNFCISKLLILKYRILAPNATFLYVFNACSLTDAFLQLPDHLAALASQN